MAHPTYSSQQLLNRGMIKVKKVASDLGVLPTGDKRLIQNWIDAIIEHQSAQVQKIEVVEATIDFESESFEGSTQPYMVLVNGEIVHRTTTLHQAERHCKWQGYTLVDSQTLAQQELEVELEVQAATKAEKAASVEVIEQHTENGFVKFVTLNHKNGNYYTVTPAHPIPKERCECGDNHFRGAECKHQLAVKNAIASRISFISPTDFGYYEAIVDNNIHHVIAKIIYLDQWNVEMVKKSKTLSSYEEAEQFIKDEYVNNVIMHSATGRIEPIIEDISMNIEFSNFVHDHGQSYTLRINGAIAGSIFLNDDHGWTMNGEDYQDDWQLVAKELIGLTHLVAA
jgi:uncharacterized protein YacL (UPF0231 family)